MEKNKTETPETPKTPKTQNIQNTQKPFKKCLSIIVIIKNRTKFVVQHKGKKLTLRLFENNLDALFKLIEPDEKWQLVIVDFKSTDVNMKQFLETKFKKKDNITQWFKPNFTYTLHTLNDRKFCKGKGLNIAPTLAKYDNLFFLDADMLINSRTLIRNGYNLMKQEKVYFPVCMSYSAPNHIRFVPRPSGTGNVFITKHQMKQVAWNEHRKWGLEDTEFHKIFTKKKLAVRNNVGTFFHQWHPNTVAWKNRFYK